MAYQGVFMFGLPGGYGSPIELKGDCERIRKIYKGRKAIKHLCDFPDGTPQSKENHPRSFHLHTKTWFDGKEEAEGTGIYFCNEEADLDVLAQCINLKTMRIDGHEYKIFGEKMDICRGECMCPLNMNKGEDENPYSKERSPLDGAYCRECKPDWRCTCCGEIAYVRSETSGVEEYSSTEDILKRMKYIACKKCHGDMKIQEKWRNEGLGASFTEKETSYVEKKYLCDEAIKKIQDMMGGKPPEPSPHKTPFIYPLDLAYLLDPKEKDYWPYGMSSQEYLEYREKMTFDNPMSEPNGYMGPSPEYDDDDWTEIEVTDDIIRNYQDKLQEIGEKYPMRDDLPKEYMYEGKKMRLVWDNHGFTCDNAICSAIYENCEDSGSFTCIPIYTSREGDLESRDVSVLTYGYERCIACLEN